MLPLADGDATLADAADAPFVVHATWALARTPDMHVTDDAALVLADSGLACDTFNFVCRARLAGADAAARVHAAVAHFRDAGRPFSWWVGPADRPRTLGALLEEAGLARAETEVAMAIDLAVVEEDAPGTLRVARVRTAAVLDDFAAVSAENWSPPDPMVPRFYRRAASVAR